ncbi:MAG: CAP domain-containing protein, partial [Myxococcota bacterium]
MFRSLAALAFALTSTTALAQDIEIGEPTVEPAPAPTLPHDRAGEARMLRRINALRAQVGHEPLARHEGLDRAATIHSQDLANAGELVHVSARTGTPADRMQQAEVDAERMAQNIARNDNTAGALAALLESEGHRAQLLDSGFTHIGLAAVRGADGVYVTQVMAVLRPPREEALPPPAV